ncbi:DUF4142 domain-containing protein [Ramlibacter sp. USB13]|uniref:DUF4142 domain-containing protein n=1 Tax=Ramlibacter cellulosilyticus TaxID=2764187 RepID=A0A923MRW7_9BURK|nr:DUF4142 domain-containing protein [Ramlibacter cellulosilyticus]MBC5784065.1 DUF4142 domain-containing protein [Ramlibacter cellulosilyticus]
MNDPRKLLAAALCAALAGPAAAAVPSAEAERPAAQPLAAVPLVRGDLQFMLAAAHAAAAEVQAAHVVLQRSVDPHVRAYAGELIEDHAAARQRLGEIAQRKGVALPDTPTQQQAYDVATLRGLAGEKLDQVFLQRLGVEAHREALARAHREAIPVDRDEELARFAQDRLPALQQHLRKAQALYHANVAMEKVRARTLAAAPDGAAAEIREAVQVVHAMQGDPDAADLLKRAYGVFILPDYARAALGVGVQGGSGVLVTRSEGRFGNPAFYRLSGISVGPQAGAASGEIALLLMTPRAVQQFVSDSRFSINFDLALTLGEFTGREQASAGKIQDIVLWSGTQGAYAGLSFGVTNVVADEAANEAYYGRPDITPLEIFAGRVADPRNNILAMVLNA